MRSFLRVIKFAFQNIWRNVWLSVITVSMLVLTLVTVNVLLVLQLVTSKAIAFAEQRIEVSVYFNSDVPEDRVVSAASFLRGLAQVRDVETISSEEALERFRVRHAADETILASLGAVEGNPFGPTLVVKAFKASDFPVIIQALDNPQFRDDIREKDFSDYESIVARIRSTTERIQLFGAALALLFLIITVLIVFNTVRVTIFIHREEIGIMKLVGASDWFVRGPYLIESLVHSAAATGLVAAAVFPAVASLEPRFNAFFSGEPTGLLSYFESHGWQVFLVQFAVLCFITTISTVFAMRKYLKV